MAEPSLTATEPAPAGSLPAPPGTQRVELHCHSALSDGALAPAELAEHLAAAGVAAAALTDHDTIAGLAEFHDTLRRKGVGCIAGLEITALWQGQEVHLLAYGFDPAHRELNETLAAVRARRAAAARAPIGPQRPGLPARTRADQPIALEAGKAIALAHRAGGKVFLAHPITPPIPADDLRSRVLALHRLGLDGIEALYGAYDDDQRRQLLALADELQLPVSAGSDAHHPTADSPPGVDMPVARWKQFRAAVCGAAGGGPAAKPGDQEPWRAAGPAWTRRHFLVHILSPTLAAMLLFVLAIFAVVLPSFKQSLWDRKREMIRELVDSAWSILADTEARQRQGEFTQEQAQDLARSRIAALRYGPEAKDYFWLQDEHPRMIMHPYRQDLDGQDVSDFRDARGTRIFVEFANLVRRQQAGYVDYVWQWKDDPHRLAPKESYIRGFAPWGWIIGTGVYLEDVHAEIALITRHLLWAVLASIVLIAGLLLYMLRAGLRLERLRADAEHTLREWTQRYRSLVEAASEGALLVLAGRLRYANAQLLRRLGYTAADLDLQDLQDWLPDLEANRAAWDRVRRALAGEATAGTAAGALRGRTGELIECALAVAPITVGGQAGCVLQVKEQSVPAQREAEYAALLDQLQAPVLHVLEPLSRVQRPALFCDLNTPLPAVAALMNAGAADAVLVRTSGGEVVGLVTDQVIRRQVGGAGPDCAVPAYQVMLSPVATLPATAQICDALLRMEDDHLRHVALTDAAGQIVGLAHAADLLQLHHYGALVLAREIGQAPTAAAVARLGRRLPLAVQALLDCGAPARAVTRLITATCDAATARLADLAVQELGPTPADFVWLALGSQGRQELTTASDQDNAIVYAAPGTDAAAATCHAYFNDLGRRVCAGLELAGFRYCNGQMMAANPEWCQPLPVWTQRFRAWIERAESKELMEMTIFFDLRPVCGQPALVQELRREINAALQATPVFFPNLARNALAFKPPLRLFGHLLAGGDAQDGGGRLDLKELLMPLVSFARLYALRQQLAPTHTLERLQALVETTTVAPALLDELTAGYEFLMGLRLRQHARRFRAGQTLDNLAAYPDLVATDQALLKTVCARLDALQQRIRHDFHVEA